MLQPGLAWAIPNVKPTQGAAFESSRALRRPSQNTADGQDDLGQLIVLVLRNTRHRSHW